MPGIKYFVIRATTGFLIVLKLFRAASRKSNQKSPHDPPETCQHVGEEHTVQPT